MAINKIKTDVYKPASLADYFKPPEGFIGSFGWVCGYSADIDFINLAAELFTESSKSSRMQRGLTSLVLLLDKGNPQLSPVEVPGVIHPGRDPQKKQPFYLLHAKVALLLFLGKESSKKWQIRLLVSTGNWTTDTLSANLDLICSLDFNYNDLKVPDVENKQIRADIVEAWSFMKEIRHYFRYTILTSKVDSDTFLQFNFFEKLLEGIPKPKECIPRFFDNRTKSLLEQIPSLLKKNNQALSRNYLAIGSGFFQSAERSKKIPSVIDEIEKELISAGVLTKTHVKDIYVNTNSCQAVASCVEGLREKNWGIRAASDPMYKNRLLHAKFLFSANERVDSNNCSSPWIYLGSGNLTKAGFTSKCSPQGGNLEAGILLFPGQLYWELKKNIPPSECVECILPLQWTNTVDDQNEKLNIGDQFEERGEDYICPPVEWFEYKIENGTGLLYPSLENEEKYEVLGIDRLVCNRAGDGPWIWNAEPPSMVEVKWQKDQSLFVPVVDIFGRIAAKQLDITNIEEAWWQLESYPNSDWEDDFEPEEFDPINMNGTLRNTQLNRNSADYPIRKMMELVENISQKQTLIEADKWKFWCNRLEQSLIQTRQSEIYKVFREMNINPLSPLWKKPFRPLFAEDQTTQEGKYYEKVLNHIEMELELNNLNPL